MQKEIHRLQKIILQKQETIKQLSQQCIQKQQSLKKAQKQRQSLVSSFDHNNFSSENVPDRQIIQTMEAKLASSTWQILQLQNLNKKYQQSIIRLQSQLLRQEQQLAMKRYQLDQLIMVPPNNFVEIQQENFIIKQWEESIREKECLIEENLILKNKVEKLEKQLNEKIQFYLNELKNLCNKIMQQEEYMKNKQNEFEKVITELTKENEMLRENLHGKNQQLLIFYQQTKMISQDKASDMHTIRNLKTEIKKKGEQFIKILGRLEQTQQLKKKLLAFNESCSETKGKFNKLAEKCETTKRQNGVIKQKLKQQAQKVKNLQNCLREYQQKINDLLKQNQVCHQLLYSTHGQSNQFKKNIKEKLEKFQRGLEKRKENNQIWLDVSDLVAVNQKLRMRKCNQEIWV